MTRYDTARLDRRLRRTATERKKLEKEGWEIYSASDNYFHLRRAAKAPAKAAKAAEPGADTEAPTEPPVAKKAPPRKAPPHAKQTPTSNQ